MNWITFGVLSALLWIGVVAYMYFANRKPSKRELQRDRERTSRYLDAIEETRPLTQAETEIRESLRERAG